MSRIGQALDKRIANSERQWVTNTTGVIIDFDKAQGTCSVKYHNPKGEGYYYKDRTQMQDAGGGFAMDNIRIGQRCNITFVNGDVANPIVTGILDTSYESRKSEDGGNYIMDSEIHDVEIPETIEPLRNDWFDYDNENPYKYRIDDFEDDSQIDVQQEITEMFNNISNFNKEESGCTNIKSKATLKFCDNGDINIFTGVNTGVKICVDGSIRFYGKDIYINDKLLTSLKEEE